MQLSWTKNQSATGNRQLFSLASNDLIHLWRGDTKLPRKCAFIFALAASLSDLLITLFGGKPENEILLVVNDEEDKVFRVSQAAQFKVCIVG